MGPEFPPPYSAGPDGEFDAQQPFMGLTVSMLAQMQEQYAMQEPKGEDGLYHDSDEDLDYIGNWVMLHTKADIASLTVRVHYANGESHLSSPRLPTVRSMPGRTRFPILLKK